MWAPACQQHKSKRLDEQVPDFAAKGAGWVLQGLQLSEKLEAPFLGWRNVVGGVSIACNKLPTWVNFLGSMQHSVPQH